MDFKSYNTLYINGQKAAIQPESGESRLYVLSDDAQVAHALYAQLTEHVNFKKAVPVEEFNQLLNEVLDNPQHRVKRCNLALVMLTGGGAFVAQMGKARVLQVREDEIPYDSMGQILDIYSAKARVSNLTDVKPDDYFLLTSAEDFDAKQTRKILTKAGKNDDDKANELIPALRGQAHGSNADEVAAVLLHVNDVSGGASGASLGFLSGIKPKHVGYTILAVAVVGVAAWLFTAKPFGEWSIGGSNDSTSVSTDSPNNQYDIVDERQMIKDSLQRVAQAKAAQDSLKLIQAKNDSINAVKAKEMAAKKAAAAAQAAATQKAAEAAKPESEAEPKAKAEPATEPKPAEPAGAPTE